MALTVIFSSGDDKEEKSKETAKQTSNVEEITEKTTQEETTHSETAKETEATSSEEQPDEEPTESEEQQVPVESQETEPQETEPQETEPQETTTAFPQDGTIWGDNLSVNRGGNASFSIHGVPGRVYSITLINPSQKASKAQGLIPKEADNNGQVTWFWKVNSNTTPGQGSITVWDDFGNEASFLYQVN